MTCEQNMTNAIEIRGLVKHYSSSSSVRSI